VPENASRVNANPPSSSSAEGPSSPDGDGERATLVYATFPSLAEAERIGGELVGMRLAACVNILPGMRSIYRWQGAVQSDPEVAMIIKTRQRLVPRVVGVVRVLHPYVNPALVALPGCGGSAEFLAWISAETADCG
jgi:periplasmic divalent cation tolerance protein